MVHKIHFYHKVGIKNGGVYTKNIDSKESILEINILVNSSDNKKVKICENIKSMLEQNGIKTNIIALQGQEFENCLKSKNYDLLMAQVYINNVPDITFLEKYLNINSKISSAINIVKESSVLDLSKNINSLQEIISNEIACIGIYATNINVVSQIDVSGISDISYMNIFNNFEKVGKIQNVNK